MMADAPIRVVVADDQTAIREALATMLDLLADIDVVGTAADGHQAVERVAELRPDVLLTDLRMPVMDGAQATAAITEQVPGTAVILLTTYDDEESILSALQAGARGYLTKEAGRDEIAAAIRTAASGQSVLDPGVQARLVQAVLAGQPAVDRRSALDPVLPDGLTRRETEVLGLIGEGLSNAEIARRLFVSEATVKTHINNLFGKAQLRDRAHAVRYAFAHGLAGTGPPGRR
jgi:DNA-binding NarL/FixJ family response regulator